MIAVVVEQGRFGAAVADALGGPARVAAGDWERAVDAARAGGLLVLATGRVPEREGDELDRACREAGVRWTSAWPWGSRIVVGPHLRPDAGPCWGCTWRRLRTHVQPAERERAVFDAFANDPELAVEGFVAPLVGMAAALVAQDAADDAPAGRLRIVDALSGALTDTRVVRVHGCPRCGTAAEHEGRRRFTEHLVPALQAGLRSARG